MKTILIIIALLLIGAATAQSHTAQDFKDSPQTSCQGYQIEHLLAAKDPFKRTEQEWNLKAAEAYKELAEIGYRC